MTVYKVVRRVRGKLYSAYVTKRIGRLFSLSPKKYGHFWAKKPLFGGPLTAFTKRSTAFEFANENHEVWEAETKPSLSSKHKRISFKFSLRNQREYIDWPRDTIFCDAIRLKRRA